MKTFIKIGDVMKSKNYGLFEVISRAVGKITIRFLDTGYVCTYDKNQVRKGNVKDCLVRSIYGVGFYGDGAYTGDKPKDIVAKALESWHSMFKRCYDTELHKRGPSYIGCTVGEAWHNFQNYAKFYIEDAFRHRQKRLLACASVIYLSNLPHFAPASMLHQNVKFRAQLADFIPPPRNLQIVAGICHAGAVFAGVNPIFAPWQGVGDNLETVKRGAILISRSGGNQHGLILLPQIPH